MSSNLQSLLKEIQNLESQVESELHRVHDKVAYSVRKGKISFPREIVQFHRSFRKGLIRYLMESNFLFILSAPVIYSMFIPAFILECFCRFYQTICFPVYRIPKVNPKDYIRFDRHKLAYLNGIEKLNCDFCAYFNGSVAFAREIAARTEQYWCPIRHALAVKGAHNRYSRFSEYGDAESYRKELNRLRKELSAEIDVKK